jgi:hypothetical protein
MKLQTFLRETRNMLLQSGVRFTLFFYRNLLYGHFNAKNARLKWLDQLLQAVLSSRLRAVFAAKSPAWLTCLFQFFQVRALELALEAI